MVPDSPQVASFLAEKPEVLLTGATGYIGGQLLQRFRAMSVPVRCLARSPRQTKEKSVSPVEWVAGDVLDPKSLRPAMQGIKTAYYLIHSMSDKGDFEETDRVAAANFSAEARDAGVERIIYLGGLGDDSDPKLSPHLKSRHEVGEVLRESGVTTIEFRAGMIVGAGSLSFQLLKSLTDRLPVMICPRWLTTPTQPIAVDDVLAYLIAARDLPFDSHQVFEIGGADIVTYGDLIRKYAAQQHLKRWLIFVPILTPYLSGLWLALVTPTRYQIGRHLIAGLKNPTVVRDQQARTVFPIRPMGIDEAIAVATAKSD